MTRILFLFMLLFSVHISAQMPSIPYDFLLDPKTGGQDQEALMTQVQAMFIQEMFVKHLFEKSPIIELDEDPIYDTSQSDALMNSLFAKEVSNMLAKQDLLNLKKFLE